MRLLLCLPLVIASAFAADEISTDRPDFTNGTDVVGRGVVQFESGYTLTHQRDGSRQWALIEPLLRLGLSDRWEVRFGGDGLIRQRDPGSPWVTGYADSILEFKVKLWDEAAHRPVVSMLPSVRLPIGSHEFTNSLYAPGLTTAIEKTVSKFDVSSNVVFRDDAFDHAHHLQFLSSLSVEHAVGHGFEAFGEVYGSLERHTQAGWIADTGLLRRLGRDFQVDFEAGRAITGTEVSWFAGVGLGVRLRLHR